MAQSEAQYQTKVLNKIKGMLPGCHIIKNDAAYQQGIPDWSIFFEHHWGMLEIKKNKSAARQPNQDYWVDTMNEMSFAAFIYPENEEEVLSALEQAFSS